MKPGMWPFANPTELVLVPAGEVFVPGLGAPIPEVP
jgi:hypothetical protein